MHIVFGGKYNGKKKYTINEFAPTVFLHQSLHSVDCSQETICISDFPSIVKEHLALNEDAAAMAIYSEILRLAEKNVVICVCDDITRGIVPLETEQRKIRDTLGRLYQMLFSDAESVTQIWFGLEERLK